MSRVMTFNHTRRKIGLRIAAAMTACILMAGQLSAESVPNNTAGAENSTRQGPAVMTSTVDRTAAQIADPIQFTVRIEVPESVTVSFPDQPQALGPFEVIGISDKLDIPHGDKRLWTRVYELESLSSGTQEIPEVAVAFTDRRGATPQHDVIKSEPIAIAINSVLEGQADPTKFRDIKGAVDLPITAPPSYTAWWIAGGTAAALATLLLIVALRKRRQLNAQQWALAELERLESEGHVEQGRVQLFYSRLTDIVRAYIERRFEIAAPRQTTDEFLTHIHDGETLGEEHRELLQQFLAQADMVKFASFCPATSEGNEAIETARRFVLETAPQKTEPEPQPAAREEK